MIYFLLFFFISFPLHFCNSHFQIAANEIAINFEYDSAAAAESTISIEGVKCQSAAEQHRRKQNERVNGEIWPN